MPRMIKAYKFSELRLKKAKQKVVDWFNNQPWYYEWQPWVQEALMELFEAELSALGLPTENIHYSLGYCQGDGMNFTGTVDIRKYMEAHNLRGWGPMEDLVGIKIESTSNHYCHWNTMRVEHEDWSDHMECEHPAAFWVHQHVSKLVEHVEARIKEVSRDLEKKGYDTIEWYKSYDFVSEDIVNNYDDKYEFTWWGDPI